MDPTSSLIGRLGQPTANRRPIWTNSSCRGPLRPEAATVITLNPSPLSAWTKGYRAARSGSRSVGRGGQNWLPTSVWDIASQLRSYYCPPARVGADHAPDREHTGSPDRHGTSTILSTPGQPILNDTTPSRDHGSRLVLIVPIEAPGLYELCSDCQGMCSGSAAPTSCWPGMRDTCS